MEQDNNRLAGPDFIASLIFILAGIVILAWSLSMPIFNRTLIVSPGLFPAIIGGVFVAFGGVIFALSVRRGGAARAGELLSGASLRRTSHSPRFWRGMIVLLAILAYVLLFGNPWLAKLNFGVDIGETRLPVNVSFIGVSSGYLFFNFVYLKALKPSAAAALSLLAALTIFYSFNLGFGIPIP
jgi:hypothetical protein